MRSSEGAAVLFALATVLGPVPLVLGAARTPCVGDRYVVQEGPLLPGAPATQVDVVTLDSDPATAELSIGCGPANEKAPTTVRATRRGTKVRATWTDCGGLAGKIRLKGSIVDDCGTLAGRLQARNVKRRFSATRSACGDGFLDVNHGESCETGSACPGSVPCGIDCACLGTTTTTSPSTPTTTTSTTLPGQCNPLSAPGAQGCPAGQKCTWIVVQDLPDALGLTGCVPDGAQAADAACMRGPTGQTTGFDDCLAGLICVGGVCRDICGFDGSANAACAAGYVCSRYSGLFANADDDPVAGACTSQCNPLTQLQTNGGPCPGGEGCYVLTSQSDTIAVCAGAGTIGHGGLITGLVSANSCLPGHQARRRNSTTQETECGALCQPTDVYMGSNEADEGGAAPYTCVSKGAPPPADATSGESCRYWWAREPFETPSAFSNTLGWCFTHAAFQYDTNGDMTPDAPFPRCPTLTTGDVVLPIGNPPHNDAQYFWCVALPAMLPAETNRLGGWR